MRTILGSFFAITVLAWPAFAQDSEQLPEAIEPPAVEQRDSAAGPAPQTPEEELDALFASLAATVNEDEAKGIEQSILRIWHRSGSATIDLLMEWAADAMEEEDYALALDYLDSVTTLAPDFAEGWNKRATALFLAGDLRGSLADCDEVVKRNPQHFGALSGYGQIYFRLKEYEKSIEYFRRALEVNPNLTELETVIRRLERLMRSKGQRAV